MADIEVENHGTVFLFRSVSEAGRAWLAANVWTSDLKQGDVVYCEHRFAYDIAQGALDAGLEVK